MNAEIATQNCTRCGLAVVPGMRFCQGCGAAVDATSAAPAAVENAPVVTTAPPPPPPPPIATASAPVTTAPLPATAVPGTPASVPFWQRPEFWPMITARAKQRVVPLVMMVALGSFDYQVNDELLIAIAVFVAGTVGTLFFTEISNTVIAKLGQQSNSALVKPLLVSIPGALFFYLRGRGDHVDGTVGTPGVGISNVNAMLVSGVIGAGPVALNKFGGNLDSAFTSFFEMRDRYVPAKARPYVLAAVSAIVTLGLVHGNPVDVMVLFGSTADTVRAPQVGRTIIAAFVNFGLAFLIMRDPAKQTDEVPA